MLQGEQYAPCKVCDFIDKGREGQAGCIGQAGPLPSRFFAIDAECCGIRSPLLKGVIAKVLQLVLQDFRKNCIMFSVLA